MTVPLLTEYARAHIAGSVVAMAQSLIKLPGGIHGGIAPEGTAYPFAVMQFISGGVANAFSAGAGTNGGGMLYQIKVVDRGNDETAAATAYAAIASALVAANNSGASGAYVAGQEESPLDLPSIERDQTFQQIGGNWRFWVDPI